MASAPPSAPKLPKASASWPSTPAKLSIGPNAEAPQGYRGTLTTGSPGEVGTPYTILDTTRIGSGQISGVLEYESWEKLLAAPVRFQFKTRYDGGVPVGTTIHFTRDAVELATFISDGGIANVGQFGTTQWKNSGTPPAVFTEDQEKTLSALQDVEALGGSAGYVKSLSNPATSATDAKLQPNAALKAVVLDCTARFWGSGAPGIVDAFLNAREKGKPIGGYWTDLKYWSGHSISSLVVEGSLSVDSIHQLIDGPCDFRVVPVFIGYAIIFSRGSIGTGDFASYFVTPSDVPLPVGNGTCQWRPGIAQA